MASEEMSFKNVDGHYSGIRAKNREKKKPQKDTHFHEMQHIQSRISVFANDSPYICIFNKQI